MAVRTHLKGKFSNRAADAGSVIIGKITGDAETPAALRSRSIMLLESGPSDVPEGFALVAARHGMVDHASVIEIPVELGYLKQGDVVRVNTGSGAINVLYRADSPHNTMLLTERCNSKCLMCSQPPRPEDDGYIVDDLLRAIPLMSPGPREIGLSGGEPTLLGGRLLELLRAIRDELPSTSIHLLTNGRAFHYLQRACEIADVRHPDLMLGIPLYAPTPAEHDHVVQAQGAFDQTVRGLCNLARVGVRTEIRVVIHRHTAPHLVELARFIARNLPFAAQVALMGLEPIGYARTNWKELWIEPSEYAGDLEEAIRILRRARIPARIYNHQLCTLPRSLWGDAVKSISDWKNIYLPACESCTEKARCGGFFAWAEGYHSAQIRALTSGNGDV